MLWTKMESRFYTLRIFAYVLQFLKINDQNANKQGAIRTAIFTLCVYFRTCSCSDQNFYFYHMRTLPKHFKHINIRNIKRRPFLLDFKCMYVCMYVCTYVCMYVCMYVCTYVCMYVCTYVCMYVRMCVCTYVCMYVCTYVCMYVCIRIVADHF